MRHFTTQSAGTASASLTTHDTVVATTAGASRGMAFPLRDESVYSVWLTSSSLALSSSGLTASGSTAIPAFTLSLNPNM